MNRAVFLDRDNTIIHNDGDLGDPAKVKLIQGAATAIASLCGLGYKVVVVTNQGGVARGKYSEDDVLLVHERIAQLVREAANGARIDRFYYCPYHPEAVLDEYRCEHPSRKPNPGMILEAAQDMGIDLGQSWTIGDQTRDVQAGAAAGTRTILLRPDADVLRPMEPGEMGNASVESAAAEKKGPPDYIVRNLTEAVRVIAHARRPEAAEHLQYAHVVGKRFDASAIAKLQHQARPGATTTRGEAEADHAETEAARRTSGKPFRPWSNMPAEEGEEPKDRAAAVRARFQRLRAEKQGLKVEEAPPTPASSAPPVSAAAAPAPPKPAETKPVEVKPTVPVEEEGDRAEAVDGVGPVVSRPAAAEPREAAPVVQVMGGEQTLKLILQELRNQRGTTDEFSYLSVIAIVLQMIAGVCLLGALWMGRGDDALFLRWISVGLILQLATLAALLFGKRR